MRTAALFALLALAAPAAPVSAQPFDPTPAPVSPDGTRATVNLPTGQHIRNVGGSDGAGLCVFTSAEHSAKWQNVPELYGFQQWMRKRPGGGWPEKLDEMIAAYCREQGKPVPRYIQHTGGDDSFLDLALKTDRLVCVTYAGEDDFYLDRWGRPVKVAHMVNLAHIDNNRAAIIDNNRPGVWVWMSRADFLKRWRAMNGGWAVVFLAAPPPAHKSAAVASARPCACGPECRCDNCPCAPAFGDDCPGGRCPLPARAPVVPAVASDATGGAWLRSDTDDSWGYWIGGRCVARCFGDGRVEAVDARGFATGARIDPPAPLPAGVRLAVGADPLPAGGVDCSKVHSGKRYTMGGGLEITEDRARALIGGGDGLIDDSDRWHLTCVGPTELVARFRGDVAALPAEVRAKLHVQCYAAAEWPVALFELPAGVSLRKPSPGRTAAEVGAVAPGEYSATQLDALLAPVTGKKPPAPAPKDEPSAPATPNQTPTPAPAPNGTANLLALVVAGVALFFTLFRRKS